MPKVSQSPYILGLDIGTNSIGWAVVSCTDTNSPTSLVALNSRIFEEMVDKEKKVPKNQKRRSARGERNRRKYYKKRRRELANLLIKEGLLPDTYNQTSERFLNDIDLEFAERKVGKTWSEGWSVEERSYRSVYAIRNFALEEELRPHEFGRLLLHLQRRRGYFSNRGAKYINLIKYLSIDSDSLKNESPKKQNDSKNKDEGQKEEEKQLRQVLDGIAGLEKQLAGRTLGQFIWQKSHNLSTSPQRITLFEFEKSRKRRGESVTEKLKFRAEREMYESEFLKIWEKQNKFHQLSNETEEKITNSIFHQRPLQLQKNKVGRCNIYPKNKRVAKAMLEYQEFRTLQVINNIKIGPDYLDESQRLKLLNLANDPATLNKNGRISWKDVAKELGVKQKEINYQRTGEDDVGTGLIGNRTAQAICSSIGVEKWKEIEKDKEKTKTINETNVSADKLLVEDLLTIHNRKALYDRLVNYWGFAPYNQGDEIEKGALGLAVNEKLESGYAKHSLKATKELLPYLRGGDDYYSAVEKIGKRETITKSISKTPDNFLLKPADVPYIANPIVQKALFEMRRVVNSIIKQYGKPSIIRMEMAREMKASKEHRAEMEKEQRKNRILNEEAEKEILEYAKKKDPNLQLETLQSGVRRVSIKDRQKFKMWKYEQNTLCPYCKKQISFTELFSGEAEIEHILPYTGFRQNHMNTLVSCRTCNEMKDKRTPYQTWGSDENRWGRIEEFVKEHYKKERSKRKELTPKGKNILKEEHLPEKEDEFVERHLNDTRYIATSTKKMLEKVGVRIDVNNGAATSELRKQLGLSNILPHPPDSSPYTETTDNTILYEAKRAGKNRRNNFHHAIDAFVVAITDGSMLKAMIEKHKQEQERQKGNVHRKKAKNLTLPNSWQGGRDPDLLHSQIEERICSTVVSHMAKRKVWGALHEETLYGKSYFSQIFRLDNINKRILKKVEDISKNSEEDDKDYIPNKDLRLTLLKWAQESEQVKKVALIKPPTWKDKEIKRFFYKTPCMVHRKEVNGKLLEKIVKEKEWIPGTNTWIAERSLHKVLYEWLNRNNLIGKQVKEIESALKKNQPCVMSKKGVLSSPIRRVSVANIMTDSFTKTRNAYVKPGSNHHFVLFNNGKERRIKMVTMIEAARRGRNKEPVIDKKLPKEWEDEWIYEMDLCVNDIVEWQCEKTLENNENLCQEHKQSPYFRVQKMSSQNDKTIDLFLRHHSVSGVDSDWGLIRVRSLSIINCRKVQTNNLGLLPAEESSS